MINLPETNIEKVTKQDKIEALDAVVIDMLTDELPIKMQNKLPNGGNTVLQAPGDKLIIKTSIVDKISQVELPHIEHKPVQSVAAAATTISIIATVMQQIDKNKAANASTILQHIGNEFVHDGKLMQEKTFSVPDMDMVKLRRGMKIAGKAFVAAGTICLTASKAAAFFSKWGK